MPTDARPPVGDPNGSSAEAARTNAEAAFSARKYEDILPSERAEMHESDPLLYKALRDDWMERGEPAGSIAGLASTSSGSSTGPLTLGIPSA
jgi:hypothetical protein